MSINSRDVTDLSFEETMDVYKGVCNGPHTLTFRNYQSVVDAWAITPPGEVKLMHARFEVRDVKCEVRSKRCQVACD